MFEVYVGDKDIQEVQSHAVGVSRPGVSAIGKRLLLSCSPALLLSCSPAVPLWPHPFSFEDISDHNEACCSSSSFALRYPARNSFPVLDLPISRCLRVLSTFAQCLVTAVGGRYCCCTHTPQSVLPYLGPATVVMTRLLTRT